MRLKFVFILTLFSAMQAAAFTAAFKIVSKKDPRQQMAFAVLSTEERIQYSDRNLFFYLDSLKQGLKPSSAVYTSQDGFTKSFIATKPGDRGREELYFIMFDIDPGNSNWRTPSAMRMIGTRKIQDLKRGDTIDLDSLDLKTRLDLKIVGE
jgi:hypothetical protein